MKFTRGSVSFHRSRATIEMELSKRAADGRARLAHQALARRHLARSRFIEMALDAGPALADPARIDKES